MEPWQRVDSATPDEARRLLFSCCGSRRWVESMIARRPFGSMDRLLGAAEVTWRERSTDDWKEAFSHHPRIGDRNLGRTEEAEQSGVADASDDVIEQLAEANREYETRFGFVFIVCATGLSADEMLARLRSRMSNDLATEIHIAAGEQARITALRLGAMR